MNNTITIYNMNNQALTVDVIRYFRMNGNRYAIVTLMEQDEQGYIKLYAVKIYEENGSLMSMNIVDETEWASVSEKIKEIIKCVREEQPVPVEDLDSNRLQGIKISDNRVFKLLSNLISLLGSNKNLVNEYPVEEPPAPIEELFPVSESAVEEVTATDNEVALDETNYKQLYFMEVAKNKKLQEKLDTIRVLVG